MKTIRTMTREAGSWIPATVRMMAVAVVMAALGACGGGGGGGDSGGSGGGGGNPPSVTAEPRAMGNIGSAISLSASASDPDGDTIAYSWRQDSGVAVSGQSGFDSATPSFTAPDVVDTLVFTVTATAGGQSDSATVHVIVVEDMDTAVFVDGNATSTGDGSIDDPYASLFNAVTSSADTSDFYIRSLPDDRTYTLWPNRDESRLLRAQSFYGGYDQNWERDPVGNPSPVNSDGSGLQLGFIHSPTTISGISLEVDAPESDLSGFALHGIALLSGDSPVVIENNSVVVHGPDGSFNNKRVEIFAITLQQLADVHLLDNIIEAGDGTLADDAVARGGSGQNGADGTDAREGTNANGGAGGAQTGVGWNGGDGGDGARTSFAGGESGERGSGRTSPVVTSGGSGGHGGYYNTDNQTEGPGGDGDDGDDGLRGSSGAGGIGRESVSLVGSPNVGWGANGSNGWAGGGGGGGGGGSGASAGRNGGGGGGGGEGGDGGAFGYGGSPGGASVAVVIKDVVNALIARNHLTSGTGGTGGMGGTGAPGGAGGSGGAGAPANFGSNAHGGDGGDGGNGGQGGYGGGGAGGPSYGIWVGSDIAPVIEENTIITGRGGDGAPPRLSYEASSAGGGGWAYGIIDSDVGDGVTPVVSNNTITAGTGGANGAPSVNPQGDSGEMRLQ
ncbi:PKD domain-containing protein [Woeseia oceani]|nr:hypothetical protein [Woeseia oceani]